MNENLIDRHPEFEEQSIILDGNEWKVSRLIDLSRNFDVERVPLKYIYLGTSFKDVTLRSMLGHIVSVNECDISHPIILDNDGFVLDGRHRLMRAIIDGKKTIKAVRFYKMPDPCRAIDT